MTQIEYFTREVLFHGTTNEECMLWPFRLDPDGYGRLSIYSRDVFTHRAAYELVKGVLLNRLTTDHLCRVRDCFNPRHLEAVTHKENTLRGETITGVNARKTHCLRDHPFDDENTYRRPSRPNERQCRACRAI